MNMPSASPAEARRRVLIWDAPVRIFHWLMVACFAGAYLTAESERWRLVHVTLGYTMLGLVAFRIVWGVAGTRHARFASFVRGPAAAVRHLRAVAGMLLRGRPSDAAAAPPGHNPAGALAIVALLAMTAVVAATGWATINDLGGGWLEELHEGAANLMLAIVGVHVGGVLLASWAQRENMIGAMLSGRKHARPEDAVHSARRGVAALLLVAVLGYWATQWHGGGAGSGAGSGVHAASHVDGASASRRGRDDD